MKLAPLSLLLFALPAAAQTAKPAGDGGMAATIKAIKADAGVKAALAGKKISGVISAGGPDLFVVFAGDCQMFVEVTGGGTAGAGKLAITIGQKACKSDKKEPPNPKVPG